MEPRCAAFKSAVCRETSDSGGSHTPLASEWDSVAVSQETLDAVRWSGLLGRRRCFDLDARPRVARYNCPTFTPFAAFGRSCAAPLGTAGSAAASDFGGGDRAGSGGPFACKQAASYLVFLRHREPNRVYRWTRCLIESTIPDR